MKAGRLVAVAVAILVVAATGCTQPTGSAGDLTIDLSPDIRICLPDQSSAKVDGTSFTLSLHSDHSGDWTLKKLVANPADNLTITNAWLLSDADQSVFGNGFPLPPTSSYPDQVTAWGDRHTLAGARIEGDPSQYVLLLQLNRPAEGAGSTTGLVLDYSDETGEHTQTASGFTVTLNPPTTHC